MEYQYPKGEIVWVGHYDKDHFKAGKRFLFPL